MTQFILPTLRAFRVSISNKSRGTWATSSVIACSTDSQDATWVINTAGVHTGPVSTHLWGRALAVGWASNLNRRRCKIVKGVDVPLKSLPKYKSTYLWDHIGHHPSPCIQDCMCISWLWEEAHLLQHTLHLMCRDWFWGMDCGTPRQSRLLCLNSRHQSSIQSPQQQAQELITCL